MGDRWRNGFIALTALVVALALASAILSPAGPAPSHSYAAYKPSATPSQSPSRSPRKTYPLPFIPTPTPTSTPTATARPSPSPTFRTHIVKAGETLKRIAADYGVTYEALLAANPDIKDPRQIFVGEVIFIPPPGWEPSPGSGSPSPSPSSS